MHWNIHLSSSGLNIYKDASDVFFMLNDSSPNPFQTPLSLSLSPHYSHFTRGIYFISFSGTFISLPQG